MALKVQILKPGDCVILPNNNVVQSITVDGDAQISSSTCNNLPEVTGYKCWQFFWEADSGSAPLDDAKFESLTVGTNVYNVPDSSSDYDNEHPASVVLDGTELKLGYWIINEPALVGLVKFACDRADGLERVLKIEIPEGLAAPELAIRNVTGSSSTTYLYLRATEPPSCEEC